MKIALISEKYPPAHGGLAQSAERLANLLQSAGHSVHVFAPQDSLAASGGNPDDGPPIHYHRLPVESRTDDTLSAWFDIICDQHAQKSFDLLHAYFITQAGFVAAYTGQYLGIPSVVSGRGNDLDRAPFEPRKAAHVLYALQHASAITVNSTQLRRKALALAPGRQVELIHNGIDADHFCPQVPDEQLAAQLGLRNRPVIGFVGEARLKKGLALLLLAYRQLAEKRALVLWLVGGIRAGEDEGLVKVFQKQNPDLPLLITDYISPQALPAYYSMMDVLVMPSLRDGLPNALLEGMACERGIVATRVGGIPDAIIDGENGLLTPPGDVPKLVDAIECLLDDASLCHHLGKMARQRAIREFTPEKELASSLRIYHRLLSGAQ